MKQGQVINTKNETSEDIDEGTIEQRIEQFRVYLNRLEPFGFSGTVFIAKGDKILIEEGYGYMDYEKDIKMRSDAVQSLGSISKQFTAMLIMRLVDQGKVQTTDTLDMYFEGIPEDKAKLTLHQLMTHTAGLVNSLGDDFEEIPTPEYIKQFFETSLQNEPGTTYAYSNLGFTLAAMIAEKVEDKPYVVLMREVWNELKITSASWFGDPVYTEKNSVAYYVDGNRKGSVREWPGSWDTRHPYWPILGNGGVTITPQDMFIYLRALFGGELISQKSLNQMLTPELNDYGYGWDILESPLGKMIRHDGGSGGGVAATARYYPDHELIVLLASNGIINGQGYAFLVEEVMEAIFAGEQIDMPPEITPFRSPQAGTYELEDGNVRIEILGNGPLLLHFEGQKLLNQLLQTDEQTAESYSQMNQITKKFGELILEKRWEEAFALSERKTDYHRRAKLLEQFSEMITQEYGPITGVRVAGTVPQPPYKGSTLLAFVTEKAAPGLPIIFQKDNEFLGFRPMISHNVFTMIAVSTPEGIIGYSPQIGLFIQLQVSDNQVRLKQYP